MAKSKISRMNYVNFEDAITANHGIILENWPLKEFCNPSTIKSRNEVTVLLRSWESGTTRFRLMDTREWKEWSERRSQQATSGDDHASSDHADSDNADSDLNLATSDRNADHARNDHADSDLHLATSADSGDDHAGSDAEPIPTPIEPTTEQADDTSPSLPSTSSTSTPPPTASATRKRPTREPSGSRTKKRAALLAADNFINSTAVTDLTGNPVLVHRKKRKERSDKGVRRGKRPAPPVAGA